MRGSGVVRAAGLAVGLAWASCAMAQSGTPLAQRRLEGRIVSVDPQDHSLTVDTSARAVSVAEPIRHARRQARQAPSPAPGGPTTKLQVAPGATVVRDGVNVPLAEVRPGDDVRASFLTDDLTRTHPWQIEVRSRRGREAPWGVTYGG